MSRPASGPSDRGSGRGRATQFGRARYAWVTFVPLCFVATTTITAGYMSVRDNFWPMAVGDNPALNVQGYVNTICTVVMMVCVIIMLSMMRLQEC